MTCLNRLSQWKKEVSMAFSHLSRPQLRGLMLWSAGIALTGAAGMCQISALLAPSWSKRNKRCFNVYASGIWMALRKAGRNAKRWR